MTNPVTRDRVRLLRRWLRLFILTGLVGFAVALGAVEAFDWNPYIVWYAVWAAGCLVVVWRDRYA